MSPHASPPTDALDAAQAQSRFVAHMSHELRTPLAGLLSLLDLAHRLAQDPVQRRYLDVAMQSGRVLQRTIDMVLDLSRLRDGALPLADEPFDAAEAVAEVLRGALARIRATGLSMRYDWVGEPTWVRGDELRLRQIVANLVDNAVKFTTQGQVQVQGTLADAAGQTGRRLLTLTVDDTGPGMSAEQARQVFDAFVQGDDSLSRRHGGVGLGLTIARELARLMGGEIALRTSPGQGSTFTLSLPLESAPDPDPVGSSPEGHAWLVFAADAPAAWIQRRLQRLGWTSEPLRSCAQAVRRASDLPAGDRPTLLIVAEQALAPDTDLDALRAALPAARIGLLIRPDWNQPQLEQRALALGMALDIMPLTPRDLRLMTAARLPPAPEVAPPVVAAALAGDVLVVEDNAVNSMIAEEFLRLLGLTVRTAQNGEQALAACSASAPRLVLMDLQMPVMDGLTATRQLREWQARGELADFPVIALTAHAMAADAQACRDAGMVGFLTKPLLLERLRSELERWIPELQVHQPMPGPARSR